MSIHNKVSAYNGIVNFLNKFNIGKPKKKTYIASDEHINNILIDYLKEHKLSYKKNNAPRYRGYYQPVLCNSYKIQDNFNQFSKYVHKNYDKNE